MKKIFCVVILFAGLALGLGKAVAQSSFGEFEMDSTEFFSTASTTKAIKKKADATDPFFISMIYYKMIGTVPDFRNLAMQSDEYLNTPDRERVYIIDDKIREFQNVYNLINLHDPIIIEAPVQLSKYNEKLQGFFITTFDDKWFYPISSYGINYAIVPEGIIDKQWMKIEDKALAEKIRKTNARAKLQMSKLTMQMTLDPIYANKQTPVNIKGKDYWVMSVKIKSMKLYSTEYEDVLWEYDPNVSLGNDEGKLKNVIKTR